MQSRALIRANVAAVYNMALECHRWLATDLRLPRSEQARIPGHLVNTRRNSAAIGIFAGQTICKNGL